VNAGSGARIGPNAIIQLGRALDQIAGVAVTDGLFDTAGLATYRHAVPAGMVPEGDVIALYGELRRGLSPAAARAVARMAGRNTGDYLLEHRIPRAARRILPALPVRLAARALLAAVTRHAWTFAGSATVRAETGRPLAVVLVDCPICRGARSPAPACDYYAATFERLFAVLVHPAASVAETECRATGGGRCRFEIRLG
jgi:divinyl protochlorophyllide a 8-vinyl-reductase